MAKILYIDLNRCLYCRSCEVACEREHHGTSYMFVTLLEDRYSVPLSCRHCEKNPCLEVCPTKAIEKTEEGAIVLYAMKCIGCKLCAIICPFGILQLDEIDKVVKKCDLCIHRLKEGKDPACVVTCPAKATSYEEFDAIMEKIREKKALSIVSGIGGEKDIIITLPTREIK
ncbi:MAG: 4Fe-4S dicluster domain-containing protein [bacterium]